MASSAFAADVSLINRQGIYARLHALDVEIVTSADLVNLNQLEEAQVIAVNIYNGKTTTLNELAAITYSTARVPNHTLLNPLLAAEIPIELVG